MTAAILKWLFGTAMGRGVLLGGSITIGLALGWWLFSAHYDSQGYQRCKDEQLQALNAANVEQAKKNAENDAASAEVGQQTADAANTVVREADDRTATTKETIEDVYAKPPSTVPLALGSCVHPVDQRVQDDIDAAVRRANAAGGAL